MSEARAQVRGHQAEGVREEWAENTATSDTDLLVKLAEARYARETAHRGNGADRLDWGVLRQQVLQELLRKAALEAPVRPPIHARFAVFLLPRAYQHIIVGDLEEQYPGWVEEYGRSRAVFLYWWQFLLSTAIIIWPRIRPWRYMAVVLWLLQHLLRAKH
jgi:hypothetical protein